MLALAAMLDPDADAKVAMAGVEYAGKVSGDAKDSAALTVNVHVVLARGFTKQPRKVLDVTPTPPALPPTTPT